MSKMLIRAFRSTCGSTLDTTLKPAANIPVPQPLIGRSSKVQFILRSVRFDCVNSRRYQMTSHEALKFSN